jgi:alpha-ribazole phosphatase
MPGWQPSPTPAFRENSEMLVHLLRHGETEGGARFWGGKDVALSPKGWEQMRAAVAGQKWDRIVTSPLQRCAVFAAKLARELGADCRCDADLREMSFGRWEGPSAADLMQTDPEGLRRFWTDPSTHAPPGGESIAELRARVIPAWQRLVSAAAGRRMLVVTHSGPIRVLRALQLQIAPAALLSIEVPYAALVAIECSPDGRIATHPQAGPGERGER